MLAVFVIYKKISDNLTIPTRLGINIFYDSLWSIIQLFLLVCLAFLIYDDIRIVIIKLYY